MSAPSIETPRRLPSRPAPSPPLSGHPHDAVTYTDLDEVVLPLGVEGHDDVRVRIEVTDTVSLPARYPGEPDAGAAH